MVGGEFLFGWGWGVADGITGAPQRCTTSCFAGIAGAGSGQLSEPLGVAVDNDPLSASHGDVYVVDAQNSRVEKFDSEGNFLLMFGGGVNGTTNGDVCLAGEACRPGTGGTEPGEFEQLHEGGGIAVNTAGNVFVGDLNRVQEFGPGGASVGQVSIAGAGSIRAIAVDSSGDVYVHGSESSGVRKFEGCAGSCVGVELGEPRDASGEFSYFARGFIALGASGELFIADGENHRSSHVREFDPSGAELASFDANSEGNEGGIAFASSFGGLYVLNPGRVRVVSAASAGPLVVSEGSGELQPTAASVNAVVNPEGHETTYRVEYGTSASYGLNTPVATLAGGAFEDEPVTVALSGLQPRTTYHFRVVASNSAGTVSGADEVFTTLPPALIDSESVSEVTATSATLAGEINPLGRDTTYRFEYGPTAAYGNSVPVPDGDAGPGVSDVPLNALVEGLTPSTLYHFRVVASNPLGVVEGPDRVFTTPSGQGQALPDGRAWEMVSPPDKQGAALDAIDGPEQGDIQSSADGSAITYVAHAPVGAEPVGNRSIAVSQILARRAAGGWSSVDIATPHEAVVGGTVRRAEYRVFSPNLSVGLVEAEGDTPLSPQASEATPYIRGANGEFTPLVTAANVPAGVKFGQLEEKSERVIGDVEFSGATPDLSHVVVSSSQSLTEGVAAQPVGSEARNLYEWFGGSLRLVSVLPPPSGKAVTEEGLSAALGEGITDGGDVRYAISDDGSRVFWGVAGGALYVRDVGRGETVRLDIVQPGARGGLEHPIFRVANSDGSRVFFTDESRLTPDSRAGQGKSDLYMCEVGVVAGRLACQLRDVTVDHNPGESAEVVGTVIGAGEDGRYAYFAASGVLAAGATPGNCPGLACKLYVYDAVTGETRFVARLSDSDSEDWNAGGGAYLGELTAGVSPDGRYLAFMSERSLTGYDNTDSQSGEPDVEVYLYDAVTGHLTCPSCNPSGARPSGVYDPGTAGVTAGLFMDRGGYWSERWLAGSIPGWTQAFRFDAFYRSRYLLDNGRLFFNSVDALVPGDTNGVADVYEYEPSGVGGCAKAGGCVSLISSGTSGKESAFLDASESGDSVFFLTAAQLVPQDLDHAFDVYDARVCTPSSPCLANPSAPAAPCGTADSCRAAPSSPSGVFGAPPSATFSGAGNAVPATSKTVARKKGLSVAQKRAAALRMCHAKPKRRRASCEKQAKKRYRVGVKAQRVVRSATRKGSR